MKFPGEFDAYVVYGSLPVQGAWIEISCWFHVPDIRAVAPRAGSVD